MEEIKKVILEILKNQGDNRMELSALILAVLEIFPNKKFDKDLIREIITEMVDKKEGIHWATIVLGYEHQTVALDVMKAVPLPPNVPH